MSIKAVHGRTIFNSSGEPTIECSITTDEGVTASASVPLGVSVGSYEACQLPVGKNIEQALSLLDTLITPLIKGKDADVVTIDALLLSADGTETKSHIGAQLMLGISIAVARVQAQYAGLELYELIAYLCSQDTVILPLPFVNFFSGGKHSANQLKFQEFLLVPLGAKNFREAMRITSQLHAHAQQLLAANNLPVSTSAEGAFSIPNVSEERMCQVLQMILESFEHGELFKIAIDVAATHFFDMSRRVYTVGEKDYTALELIDWYSYLISNYPICSIEDGLHQDDQHGWRLLTERLGQFVQIAGDDIFATQPHRIYEGAHQALANAVVIKPNQIGTITETLQAMQLAKEFGYGTQVSNRCAETNDSFIADLAVGASAGQIKAGGFSHGERMAKYNRLLEIEEHLMLLASRS